LAHQGSYPVYNVVSFLGKKRPGRVANAHLHLVSGVSTRGALPPLTVRPYGLVPN
jgi:hypothetical protein